MPTAPGRFLFPQPRSSTFNDLLTFHFLCLMIGQIESTTDQSCKNRFPVLQRRVAGARIGMAKILDCRLTGLTEKPGGWIVVNLLDPCGRAFRGRVQYMRILERIK